MVLLKEGVAMRAKVIAAAVVVVIVVAVAVAMMIVVVDIACLSSQ